MGFLDKIINILVGASYDDHKKDVARGKSNNQTIQIPELQGDYAKALFLNAYQKASLIKDDSQYQRYLIYECGIKEPSKYHLKMIEEGYLEKSSVEDVLRSLKVDELKVILEELGQKKSGKKEELILRIIDNADADQLIGRFSQDKYCITIKGRQFLEQHYDYVKLHQHSEWGINWKEYDSLKRPGFNFNDIVWGIFNQRIMHSINFGRNEYFNMFQLLAEEGRREAALEKLLMVFRNDLSGVQALNCYNLFKSKVYSKKELEECFNVAIMLAPGIISKIKEYGDVYSDDILKRVYEIYRLPIQICDEKLFSEIIHAILDNTYSEEVVISKLKQRYNQYIKEL